MHDQTHFDAIAQVGVGPVRGKFKLKFELMPAASGDRMDMKISGGGFGSAVDLTAGADVIDAGAGTTRLAWSGQAIARGPVAAVPVGVGGEHGLRGEGEGAGRSRHEGSANRLSEVLRHRFSRETSPGGMAGTDRCGTGPVPRCWRT